MRIYVLIIVAILVYLGYKTLRWMKKTPPHQVKQTLLKAGIITAAGLLVLLVLTGRVHWIFALAGLIIPLVQRFIIALGIRQFLQRLWSSSGKRPDAPPGGGGGRRTSTLNTRYLHMTLDHASGQLDGKVMAGEFQGQNLSDLTLPKLQSLLRECRLADEDSVAVLEAYLDRRFERQWRHSEEAQKNAANGGGEMTLQEAYSILGLTPDASKEDVKKAYKRMIQKVHPDRGGSAYLAAKLNQAKELLVKHIDQKVA